MGKRTVVKRTPNISQHVIEDYIPAEQPGDTNTFVFLALSQSSETVDVEISDSPALCAQAAQKTCPRPGVSYAAAVKTGPTTK